MLMCKIRLHHQVMLNHPHVLKISWKCCDPLSDIKCGILGLSGCVTGRQNDVQNGKK